jgi:hypothetical protein
MKTTFLLFLLMLGGSASRVMAQTAWVQAMSGGTQSQASTIATDASGNSYVGGSFTGTITISGTVLQAATTVAIGAYLAKYSPQGALLWVRQPTVPGALSRLWVESVAVDGSGNVIMGGTFSGGAWTLGNVTLAGHPAGALYGQGFVAKLDPAGTISWAQAAVDTGSQGRIGAVAVDASGTVYAAGGFTGSSPAAFIKKYSAAGVLQPMAANSVPGGTGSITISGLAVSPNGQRLAMAGWLLEGSITLQAATGSTPALVVSTPGGTSSVGFVAGYSAAGVGQWVQTLACGSNNRARLQRVVAAGSDFLTCGLFTGMATIGTGPGVSVPGAANYSNGFVARLDGQGTVQWARGIQSTSYVEAWDVAADGNGNAYIAGNFMGQLAAAAGGLSNAGGSDAYLLVYGPQGSLLSAQRDGGVGQEFFTAVALTAAGQPRVGGYYTFGAGSIAGASLPTVNFNTAFVASLATTVLATSSARNLAAFTVAPVPARSGEAWQLAVASSSRAGMVRVVDVLGREMCRQVFSAHETTISVPTAGLAPGHYVLQVLSPSGVATRRVAVE